MFPWLRRLDQHFPVRYSAWLACAVVMMLAAFSWVAFDRGGWLALICLALTLLGVRDTQQARHAVLRNYPVIGHLRFLLEYIRPEMRQYFIESDNEAAPFSRQQRSLVYQRAKGDPDKRPFGTQMDVGALGYEWINHSLAPSSLPTHDFRVTIGDGRAQPYSASIFNISAMSFGALSANAILALNEGARRGGFAHDTGEGSISRHHRANGGDLIWEIGSGYFGCRKADGTFSEERFVEHLRELSGGKPTGFKLCIGHPWEWFAIAKAMLETGIVPDFIVVDGAEGGTGAAPLEFTDHVGAPLQEGLMLVHNTLVGLNLRERIRIGCAGKVISAFDIARAIALGADWCNSARGFMFALGCIQAQSCHTGNCPTGVTTQDALRQRALDVPSKAQRVLSYHQQTLHALQELVQAAGLSHPREITASHIVRRNAGHGVKLLANLLPFVEPGSLLAGEMPHQVFRTYWPLARTDSFARAS